MASSSSSSLITNTCSVIAKKWISTTARAGQGAATTTATTRGAGKFSDIMSRPGRSSTSTGISREAVEALGAQRDRPLSATSGESQHPYRLHAHCTKHNTILNLTRDVPKVFDGETTTVRQVYEAAQRGGFRPPQQQQLQQQQPGDSKVYGQTVLRTSCGTVGFKKGQRSSFEAATRAANKMIELIDGLGWVETTTQITLKLTCMIPAPPTAARTSMAEKCMIHHRQLSSSFSKDTDQEERLL